MAYRPSDLGIVNIGYLRVMITRKMTASKIEQNIFERISMCDIAHVILLWSHNIYALNALTITCSRDLLTNIAREVKVFFHVPRLCIYISIVLMVKFFR